jgi:hypothetical protein
VGARAADCSQGAHGQAVCENQGPFNSSNGRIEPKELAVLNELEPNVPELHQFIDAMFCRAGQKGYVSSRAYTDDKSNEVFRITPVSLEGGLARLKETAEKDARDAAKAPKPVVYCPPIVVLKNNNGAKEDDILLGLALTVDCDKHDPRKGLTLLSRHLGSPTVEVKSGGKGTDPFTGQVYDKLHSHWRLRRPAATKDELRKLKKLRKLAAELVDGDRSSVPPHHPIRWPGSIHRKGEPTLCVIETLRPDREIDLDTALAALKVATGERKDSTKPTELSNDDDHPYAEVLEIAAALRAIPNDLDRPEWVRLGAAVFRATKGVPEAFDAFDEFSQKWPDYNAANTRKLWESFEASPPTQIGAGTVFYLASEADPDWFEKYEEQKRAREEAAKEKKPEQEQPQGSEEAKPEGKLLLSPLFIDTSKWDDEPAPEQEWAVQDRIPLRQVALFSGEGGAGKSTTELHLCFGHALERNWLGALPASGPAIFIDAEDDVNVLRRRGAAVLAHYGST